MSSSKKWKDLYRLKGKGIESNVQPYQDNHEDMMKKLEKGSTVSDPGLLIDIEYSRVRDSSWMYLISFVTTRNRRRTSCSTRKLPDRVVVGLQLYSARTFHVTLSPRIYKGGQGPPQNTSTPKAIQTTIQDIGYYATRGPNLSKSLCSLHHRVLE